MVSYTENEVVRALEAIGNGLSVNRASIVFGVPRSTLRNRRRGHQTRAIAFADLQRLPPWQEDQLAQWVRIQHNLGVAPTHEQLREFAERVLRSQGDTNPLGKRWIDAFLRRNPSIKVQRSRTIDSRRLNGATTDVIKSWFRLLDIPEISDVKQANRYNMDETGILEGKGFNGLVLGMAETTAVRKKEPGSRAWVSIIECISADGRAIKPLVIYKGKSVQQQWFPLELNPYAGWEFTATDNGWTTDNTALEWLKTMFLPQRLSPLDEPRLLVLDGHGSHTTTEFMWECYRNNVYLLFLPPHTSHVLQPLDMAVFGPIKSKYRKELSKEEIVDNSTIVGKRYFLSCYQKARLAGLTSLNIRSGWKATGLYPPDMARPLTNPMVLPNPVTPTKKTADAGQVTGSTRNAVDWASAASVVDWSTPRKASELCDQLKLFTELSPDHNTQRLLFRKVEKAFSEQAYHLAASQHHI
ncbi:transposase [Colletotrichum limetticola]|uniref:Transposase n=1 Tax=Colletotrichum limetticola TaxID=1209924 RepID=A0ABQ9P835_9PEZI|nr:transposase [Colletotrichum limetticola]